jgi:hypothetical protein
VWQIRASSGADWLTLAAADRERTLLLLPARALSSARGGFNGIQAADAQHLHQRVLNSREAHCHALCPPFPPT